MNIFKYIIASLIAFLLSVTTCAAQDPGWPRTRTDNGNALVIYQPQVDEWTDYKKLDWRMAIQVTPKDGKTAVGIVVLKGDTDVDNDNKMVLITNIKILEIRFPSCDSAHAERLEQLVRTFLPQSVSITLQQLVACVPKKETAPGVELKNDPPRIFVSYQPAILLETDGNPVHAKMEKTSLEYIVNTHWPLFYDTAEDMFYLAAGRQWLSALRLEGPWGVAKNLPMEMNGLPKDARWTFLRDIIPPPENSDTPVPTVYFSKLPAELLIFHGQPAFEQIPDTRLQFAVNTKNYLFRYMPTNRYYHLSSGRWFRAKTLNGPWTFATPDLPADFKKIPGDIPAGQVLASVPGTEEAKDAVLMAQIPTTVTINPENAAAHAKVSYDGPPKFKKIEGTSLYYATNTAQKVIRAGDLYYLCLQAIWFVSTTPEGPWQTAKSVPAEIYTIPPSSPVYNVTYVTQVTTADGSVQSSYTAGYTGVYVTSVSSGVVVTSGTGYYYPSYIIVYPTYPYYPVYYPMPLTYGASSYYHSATGAYGVSQTAYGEYGTATRAASYNPYTGTSARAVSTSTEYGSAAAGRAYNPYTGAYGATRQGSNEYASWGSSVVTQGGESAYSRHYSTDQGSVATAQSSTGGKAYSRSTQYGSTSVAKTSSGDLYAGHDGNAYKKTDSGWEKYEDGNWSSVEKPTPSSSTQQSIQNSAQHRTVSSGHSGENAQMHRLNQESQNRQRGSQSSQRFQSFQRSGHSFGGGQSQGGSFGGGRSFGRGRR